MTLTIHEVEQRDAAWYELRRGMVTASVIGQLISSTTLGAAQTDCPACGSLAGYPCSSKRTGGPIATLHPERAEAAREADITTLVIADNETTRGLAATLAAERIAGIDPIGTYFTRDMERGVLSEDPAREAYTAHYGTEVEPCGFMVRDFDGFSIGLSPDGLVGEAGLVEIKAPRRKGHVETVISDQVPAAHVAQIQTALLVSGRDWCDFVSFAGGMRLWTKRVTPDPDWHTALIAAAKQLEATIQRIVATYEAATAGFPMTDLLPEEVEMY